MYKNFQGNAKMICDKLNENKMKIHSIELYNGRFHCIAEPSNEEKELKSLAGSIQIVTKNLNSHERKVEGRIVMMGHSAFAFYRCDEEKEAKIDKQLASKAKADKEAQEKAQKEAKKAEAMRKMEELKAEMESIDSEPSDEEKAKAKADKEEKARQAEMKKEAEKKDKADKEAKAKKEANDKAKKDSAKKADK